MDYSYSYETSGQSSPIVGFIYFALIVFLIVCIWKIFQKAGEPGWKSIVPIYNSYTLTKLLFASGWYFLIMLVPIANIVFEIMLYARLSKAFGKGIGFTLGLIFLPVIFFPILAFGSAQYIGNPAFMGAGAYPQQGYNPNMQVNNNYDPNNTYGQNNNGF